MANIIAATIIPLFLIILAGYLIGRKKKTDITPFVDLIMYITGPCIIFTSIVNAEMTLAQISVIGIASALIILIQGIIAYFIFRKRKGIILPAAIGNTGYLGYPLAFLAFGSAGLSLAVIYDAVGSLFLFSLGVFLVHQKNDFREIFRLPLIYAILLGIIASFGHIAIPAGFFTGLEMLGSITIPLALLILGYRLSQIRMMRSAMPYFVAGFKMIGGLCIAVLVSMLLGMSGLSKTILVLQASMPSAVMSMILTYKYRNNHDIAASAVFLSTLLSAITIPALLYFFG